MTNPPLENVIHIDSTRHGHVRGRTFYTQRIISHIFQKINSKKAIFSKNSIKGVFCRALLTVSVTFIIYRDYSATVRMPQLFA